MWLIEVKNERGRWIKFRLGSERGPQASFPTEAKAKAWLGQFGASVIHYRTVQASEPPAPPKAPARDYPFCDTSRCPWWRGYCSRDPACND